jgi:hypothetical protein
MRFPARFDGRLRHLQMKRRPIVLTYDDLVARISRNYPCGCIRNLTSLNPSRLVPGRVANLAFVKIVLDDASSDLRRHHAWTFESRVPTNLVE